MESIINTKIEVGPRVQKWRLVVERLADVEKSKNLKEIEVIQGADEVTAKVIESYGLQSSLVVPENVHIIRREEWPDGHAFFSREHGLFVCEDIGMEHFKMKVIHEMFHCKGVNFLPIPLTEAIVEKLTNQALNYEDKQLVGNAVFSGVYTYNEYRVLLDDLLRRIVQRSGCNQMQAFSNFAKAHLTGVLEHLSVLDEVFGSGTMNRLNELDDNPDSLRQLINTLQ
jgi:hypothetical protein